MKTIQAGFLPAEFSLTVFGIIAAQWREYNRGRSPARHSGGRGAQNPRLLRAFDALDRAEARARPRPQNPR